MTQEFNRLEAKVDSLLEAVTKLVLFEERQSVQAVAIMGISVKLEKVEKDLDKWIQRGIGAWALVITLWTVLQSYRGYL